MLLRLQFLEEQQNKEVLMMTVQLPIKVLIISKSVRNNSIINSTTF